MNLIGSEKNLISEFKLCPNKENPESLARLKTNKEEITKLIIFFNKMFRDKLEKEFNNFHIEVEGDSFSDLRNQLADQVEIKTLLRIR